MIPTVEDILLDLAAGKITHAQAMAWMEQHFKLCAEEACALPEVGARDAALEEAAKVCDRIGQPGDEDGYTESDTNAFIWKDKEAEWAAIKLEDAATAIRALKSSAVSPPRTTAKAKDNDFDPCP